MGQIRRLFGSKIVRKLILRILAVEAGTFALIMIASALFLWPWLQNNAVAGAAGAGRQVAELLNQVQTTAMNDCRMLLASGTTEADLLNYLRGEGGASEKARVSLALHGLISSQDFIQYIRIEDASGRVLDSISNQVNIDLGVLDTDWYRNIRASTHTSGFSRIIETTVPVENTTSVNEYLIMAYATNYYLADRKITICMFCNIDRPVLSANGIAASFLDDYAIVDQDGGLVYSYRKRFSPGEAEWRELLGSNIPVQTRTKTGYRFLATTSLGSWRVLSYASYATINGTFLGFFGLIALLFTALAVLTFVLITPVVARIVQPVHDLSATMARVSDGNLDLRSDIGTDDEIGDLSRMFNSMVDSIQNSIRTMVAHEETEQRMRYSLLISQIDPHFIYNTMNIITSLARQGKTEEIVRVNQALIRFLQDRLRINEIQVYDTVRQEIDVLRQYVSIINHRYENEVRILWDVAEDLLDEEIPKNLLQPLVENAYFHGLISENGEIEGEMRIAVLRDEKDILLRVSDNGNGMSREMVERLNAGDKDASGQGSRRGRHIGVANVRERLAYLYGNEDCMRVESVPGEGTTVTLILRKTQPLIAPTMMPPTKYF